MEEVKYFLGVAIDQETNPDCIWISQPAYTQRVLDKFGMDQAKPVSTPVDASAKLVKTGEDDETVDQVKYQSAVGSLLYLSMHVDQTRHHIRSWQHGQVLFQSIERTLDCSKTHYAICMAKNPQFHGRAKHIGIKFHYIQEQVERGAVALKYCPSNDMIADMPTKGLAGDQFYKLRKMAGVRECPQ